MNNFIKNQKGSSLILVFLILASILIMAVSASDLVISGLKMSRTQLQSTKAYFASEAGVERSLWEARKSDNWSFPQGDQEVFSENFADGTSYIVDYNAGDPNISFLSLGGSSDVRRSVKVSFQVSGGIGGIASGGGGCAIDADCSGECQTCSAERQCVDDASRCINPPFIDCFQGQCIECYNNLDCPDPTTSDCLAGVCVTECEAGLEDCNGDGDCECNTDTHECSGISCVEKVVLGKNLLNYSDDSAEVVYIGGTANPWNSDLTSGCSYDWRPQGTLCDEGSYANSKDISYKTNENSGACWSNSEPGVVYGTLIIDLGSIKTFDEVRVFQMADDYGRVTHAKFAVHPETGEIYPGEDDIGWLYLNDFEPVGAGNDVNGDGLTMGDPTVFYYSDTTTRYFRVDVKNDGSYGYYSWLDFRNIKMFNN